MPPRKEKHPVQLLSYTSFFEMPPDFLERPLPYHVHGRQNTDAERTLLEDRHTPPQDEQV